MQISQEIKLILCELVGSMESSAKGGLLALKATWKKERVESSVQKRGSTERRTQANPPLGGGVGGGRFA